MTTGYTDGKRRCEVVYRCFTEQRTKRNHNALDHAHSSSSTPLTSFVARN
jgi:hypothetical protein